MYLLFDVDFYFNFRFSNCTPHPDSEVHPHRISVTQEQPLQPLKISIQLTNLFSHQTPQHCNQILKQMSLIQTAQSTVVYVDNGQDLYPHYKVGERSDDVQVCSLDDESITSWVSKKLVYDQYVDKQRMKEKVCLT